MFNSSNLTYPSPSLRAAALRSISVGRLTAAAGSGSSSLPRRPTIASSSHPPESRTRRNALRTSLEGLEVSKIRIYD